MNGPYYTSDLHRYSELRELYLPIVDRIFRSSSPQEYYDSLEDWKKRLYALMQFLNECANGGVSQYFFNQSGDEWPILRKLLIDLGCDHTLKTLDDALAFFSDSSPSVLATLRQKECEMIEQKIGSLNKRVDYIVEQDLCERFIRTLPTHIISENRF